MVISKETYASMIALLASPCRYITLGQYAYFLGEALSDNPYAHLDVRHPSRVQWEQGWKLERAASQFFTKRQAEDKQPKASVALRVIKTPLSIRDCSVVDIRTPYHLIDNRMATIADFAVYDEAMEVALAVNERAARLRNPRRPYDSGPNGCLDMSDMPGWPG